MYADAVAYSRLVRDDYYGTHKALKAAFAIFDDVIGRIGGRIIMKSGDSVLAEFPSISAAVSASAEIQRMLRSSAICNAKGQALRFRIGINLGDIINDDDNIYGDGVNLAERVQCLGEPGGICVTEAVFSCLEKAGPYRFEYGGEHAVKNFEELVRVYHWRLDPGEAQDGSPTARHEDARRYLTIVAGRLMRDAAIAGEPEPEHLGEVNEAFSRQFHRAVARHSGVQLASVGDLSLAAFGLPFVRDDDAARSVAAAMELRAALAAAGVHGLDWSRTVIGIDIGLTIVQRADPTGAYRVVGQPVSNALMLTQGARSGGIFATKSLIPILAKSYDCSEAGDVEVDGARTPVWRVADQAAADRERQGPLVGRAFETSQLLSALKAARAHGAGCVIELRGEAGIGKSRLARQALSMGEELRFHCHRTAATALGGKPGGGPVASILRSILAVEDGSSNSDCAPAIETSALVEGLPAHLRAFVYDLLDLPPPASLHSLFAALDNSARKQARRSVLVSLVTKAATAAPLLIVVEDIHWADRPLLDALRDLAGCVSGAPVVLIFTARPESGAAGSPRNPLGNRAAILRLDLMPLRDTDSRELASGIGFEPTNGAQRDFVERCVQRAAGNPLFLEQLLRHTSPESAGAIPSSILSIVAWRVDQLLPPERRALEAASVLGERFPAGALGFMLDEPGHDPKALVEGRLLIRIDDDFAFEHALIQEAIYQSIRSERRLGLHRRAALWLRDRDPLQAAEHFFRAKAPEAVAAHLQAARQQCDRFRFTVALELVERGLVLAESQKQQFELLAIKGDVLFGLGLVASSTSILRQMSDFAENDDQRVRAAIALATNLIVLDQYPEALAQLNQAEPIAAALGDRNHRWRIHQLRGSLHFPLGDTDRCHIEHRKAFQLAREMRSTEAAARALSGLGDAEYARGHMRKARRDFGWCVGLAVKSGHVRIEAENRHMVASSLHYIGRLGDALIEAERALEVATQVAHPRAELCSRSCISILLYDLDRFDEVEQHVEKAQSLARTLGARRFVPLNLTFLAKVARHRGQQEAAERLIAEALAESRRIGMSYNGARVLSEFALITRDASAARDALAEGERILTAGCIASNHLWFYRDAIDAALALDNPDAVDTYIGQFIRFAGRQRLPWTMFFAMRGRLLQSVRTEGASTRILGKLSCLRARALAFDYRLVHGEITALLQELEHADRQVCA